MTWAALILADPSPCLRWLALKTLLNRPEDDPEMLALEPLRRTDPLIKGLLGSQASNGSWGSDDLAASSHPRHLVTSQALLRLGTLGFRGDHPAVDRAAQYLFAMQGPEGAWPLPDRFSENPAKESYDTVPLQTALPLRGLAACGYAQDPRAEKAYDWLLAQRLEDGAWPTGTAAGSLGYVAGYRRLPHSRWGCRSNTTGALCCLALHPARKKTPPAQRALDLLLGIPAREPASLGFEAARIIGAEPYRGFFTTFARFDAGLLLRLCASIGASIQDPRVQALVDFIRDQQGPYGLWQYTSQPQASRWVTYDLLSSLNQVDQNTQWISLEPPTPFKAEPFGKKPLRH